MTFEPVDINKKNLSRLFQMDDVIPNSDEPIGGPIPTILDTLAVIRMKNIDEVLKSENFRKLGENINTENFTLYGHILVYSESGKNVLYSPTYGYNSFGLGIHDLVKSLGFYFSNHIQNRQLLTFPGADVDAAVREAGSIQFIKEQERDGRFKIRNLYK